MNRRQFLTGLVGILVIDNLPAQALLEEVTPDWTAAIEPILYRYMADFIAYGSAAISTCEKFPYLYNIPIEDFLAFPEIKRSTGDY